jgi:hypothetical protein
MPTSRRRYLASAAGLAAGLAPGSAFAGLFHRHRRAIAYPSPQCPPPHQLLGPCPPIKEHGCHIVGAGHIFLKPIFHWFYVYGTGLAAARQLNVGVVDTVLHHPKKLEWDVIRGLWVYPRWGGSKGDLLIFGAQATCSHDESASAQAAGAHNGTKGKLLVIVTPNHRPACNRFWPENDVTYFHLPVN